MYRKTKDVTRMIQEARKTAHKAVGGAFTPPENTPLKWPVQSTVGPGLEGVFACETEIGYVNGTEGQLVYRGYDVFDLCANSSFEEVSYLLLKGNLPERRELKVFKEKLHASLSINNTLRLVLGFPLEQMHPMAALRLGVTTMRRSKTWRDDDAARGALADGIAADEDSIAMDTKPLGGDKAVYEFKQKPLSRPKMASELADDGSSVDACIRLIGGMSTLVAGIARIRGGELPVMPLPDLSHAGNLLYMMTGTRPTPEAERVMDVALILHADHGLNASTFASLVVASTMSDIYFSIGAGIGALSGPLHGGANEEVIRILKTINGPENVDDWFAKQVAQKKKIPGFGHRVYKAYDPRARILGPLAHSLCGKMETHSSLYSTAVKLEQKVLETLAVEKNIFPNVDFYSGLVYACLGIKPEMFTPIFAASRVSGWTARVLEYLQHNRIFRPRAHYTGPYNLEYQAIGKRKRA